MNINREGLRTDSGVWADGATALEAGMTQWLDSIEPALAPGARCNISIWSNEYYLLAAVASFTVDGNDEDEVVLEVGFHRGSPADRVVEFTAEICRDNGPPLAVMAARKISLDSSDCISKVDLDTAIAAFRSFSYAQVTIVVQHLADFAQRR